MSAQVEYAELQRRATVLGERLANLRVELERLQALRSENLRKPRRWFFVRLGAALAVAVLTAAVTALGFTPYCRSQPIDDRTVIHLERNCFGDETCDDHALTIYGDGRVVFHRHGGEAISHVSLERVQQIADLMLQGCFLRMRSYQHWNAPVVRTAITIGGELHEVEHFANGTCVAPKMVEIEQSIESIAVEQHWLPPAR